MHFEWVKWTWCWTKCDFHTNTLCLCVCICVCFYLPHEIFEAQDKMPMHSAVFSSRPVFTRGRGGSLWTLSLQHVFCHDVLYSHPIQMWAALVTLFLGGHKATMTACPEEMMCWRSQPFQFHVRNNFLHTQNKGQFVNIQMVWILFGLHSCFQKALHRSQWDYAFFKKVVSYSWGLP